MSERARRIAGWLTDRLLGWRSPSLSAMGLRRTFRHAWTGRLEDCEVEHQDLAWSSLDEIFRRSHPDRVSGVQYATREDIENHIGHDIGIDADGNIPIVSGREAVRQAIVEMQEQQRRAVEAAVQDVVDEAAARIRPDLPPPKFTIDRHSTPDRSPDDRQCVVCGEQGDNVRGGKLYCADCLLAGKCKSSTPGS